MAEEIYRDQNQPPTGMINAAEDGVIWIRPDGTVIRATREGFFQVPPEQAAAYLEAPEAGAQAEALAGVPAPAAAAAPPPAAAGPAPAARAASDLGVRSSRFKSGADMAREQQRAETERSVQGAMAQELAAAQGPLGGLSIGERGMVAKLIQSGEAADEAEATKMIIAARPKAEEQGEALQER